MDQKECLIQFCTQGLWEWKRKTVRLLTGNKRNDGWAAVDEGGTNVYYSSTNEILDRPSKSIMSGISRHNRWKPPEV